MSKTENAEKHKNKNMELRFKEDIFLERGDKLDCDTGKVDMIKIKRDDNDSSSALMDIEVLLNTFKHYPIVFQAGDMCIHLKYDKKFRAKMITNTNTKMILLTGLTDICNIYKTFVIFGTEGDKIHVLPKNAMTYFLFDKLRMSEESMNVTVLVELRDIIPIYYKGRKKNTSVYLKSFKSNIHTIEHETNVQISTEEVSDNRDKRQLDTSLKNQMKELKSRLSRVTLPQRERVFCHYPVEDGLYKYPTQVSSDEQQTDEQVTSAGHSSIFSDSHSYAFGNSLHLFQNNSTLSAASNRPTNPARYRDYMNYNERLTSYLRWPLEYPTSAQLSKVGFFYTNQGDLVRCFQCGIGLKDFSDDDDPLMEHVRHSGQCPFLPKLLGEERLATLKRQLQQVDPEFNRRQQLNGIEDQVRCFACDGGLRRWDPEDDPWTEHCRWFPACPYALEQKGEQFIALVQASVENERFEASGGTGPDDMTGAMERLRLRDSETDIIIKQHAPICRDMGFEDTELKEAVLELRDRGNTKPSIEDIVDAIEVIRDRKQANIETECNITETPVEENKRLKSHVFCMMCGKNEINALFLPCTHHRLCMSCAEPLQTCAVCHRYIKEKIRTYMA
ncbi:baculoviral IAP repeat-containing protein 3-like isoform X2 [Mercenaria mercenaria]|uniref:baculoviral IAP repeat-containing protein 3-like isoform X2 n=1 Tax=Mercenaria mercenaria TaxID=6596 RepID=UPI00234EFBAB|nr:baculoviral IAP repeat-containing protein 3-like isoform X2 [Mercenaria mercenaria]